MKRESVDAQLKVRGDRIVSDRIVSDRIVSDRIVSDRIVSDRIVSDRIVSDRIVSDRIVSDRIVSDRIVSDDNFNEVEILHFQKHCLPLTHILNELAFRTTNSMTQIHPILKFFRRFTVVLNMRATRCPVCLDSILFGRQVSKCSGKIRR